MSHESNNPSLAHTLNHVKDIQAALFELCHADSMVIVRNAADHEVAVEILALNHATRQFYWRPRDYAGADFADTDRQGMLAGSVFHFDAQSYGGVQILFQVDRPQLVRADNGTPALCSRFPEQLVRIQRRGAFRAYLDDTRLVANAIWRPDVAPYVPLKFRVRDLSINGIGMRIDQPLSALPTLGSHMQRVTLQFERHGDMQVDLAVQNLYPLERLEEEATHTAASHTAASNADGPLTHLGARFIGLDARQTGRLQKIVWAVENARKQPTTQNTTIWKVKRPGKRL